MKQGELLQLAGSIQRRAKGSLDDFETIEDLTPYTIEIALQQPMSQLQEHRFKVYKEGGGFYTDAFDTSTMRYTGVRQLTASLVIEGVQVVARNAAEIKIDSSEFGKSVASTLTPPDYGDPSPTEGAIEAGEWEYIICLARTGSDAEIGSWSESEGSIVYVMGVVIKGEDGTSVDLSNYPTKEELEKYFETEKIKVLDRITIGAVTIYKAAKTDDDGNEVEAGYIYTDRGNIYTTKGNIYTSDGEIYASKGDIYTADGDFVARNGSFFKGTGDDKTEVAYKDELPTKTSELTNDSNFTTLSAVLEQVYKKSETITADEVKTLITIVQDELDTLVGGDASSAIDSYNEIVAFLSSFSDSEDLASVLLALKNEIVARIPSLDGYIKATDSEEYEGVESIPIVTTPQNLTATQQAQVRKNINASEELTQVVDGSTTIELSNNTEYIYNSVLESLALTLPVGWGVADFAVVRLWSGATATNVTLPTTKVSGSVDTKSIVTMMIYGEVLTIQSVSYE